VSRSAYRQTDSYDYGSILGLHGDFYFYPGSFPVGIFANISWTESRFPDINQLSYIKTIPFRAGFLFNFKNQAQNKDRVVAQVFADRTNLDTSPNKDGQGWRFGLGIGLPISFK
jgi:hypothetical protein